MAKSIIYTLFLALICLLAVNHVIATDPLTSTETVTSNTPSTSSSDVPTSSNSKKLIHLRESNFVSLNGPINSQTASRFVSDILKISGDKIYIYIRSPGGSVIDGNDILQVMESLTTSGKQLICIADKAMSMAFVILQYCTHRTVMDHSILMQHQMSVGMSGPIEQVRSRQELSDSLEDKMNTVQAARLKLSVAEFKKRTNNDWWIYSNKAFSTNAADELVQVTCDRDIIDEKNIITIRTWFGDVDVTYSKCPLVASPLKINWKNIKDQFDGKVSDIDLLAEIDGFHRFKEITH